jgi:class 3 adenylate cyclase
MGPAGAVTQQLPPGTNGELSRIFPWLRQQPNFLEPEPITDPEPAQFRLFEAYAAFLRAMANQTPLLIALDDLHWADKPTLLLLQHIARELSRLRILIVGNYRDTDLSRTHPLSEALAALNRDPGFTRVVLRGLTEPEVGSYIRATANVEPRPELVRHIFEETEGNPFFLSEVVNLMAQEGTLTRESVSDIHIPDGVREALGRRLDRISPEANELLQMCAIAGREFTYDTLTLTGDRDENQLLRLIEEALKARVIEEMEQAGRYRFTHALMQETLLDELSTTRRAHLHGQVGEALERRWGDRLAAERAPRLAHHFVESAMLSPGHVRKAVHYSKLAAEQAEAATAWAEAARHYESCLTLITASEEALGEDEAALHLALARCLRYGAQTGAAWRSLSRATTIYRERGDGAGMARAALEASDYFAPREQLVAVVEEALNLLGESDLRLRAHLLFMRAGDEWDDAAKAAAGEAERIVHTLDDPALLGRVAYRQAWEALGEWRIDEAVSLFRRAHGLLDEGGERQRAGHSFGWAAVWILFEGRLDEGVAALQDALAYDRKFHVRLPEIYCLAALQAAALIRCDFRQFDFLLNETPGASDAAEASAFLAVVCAARAEMSGDTAGALKLAPAPLVPFALGSLARTSFNAGHEDQAREYLAEFSKQLSQWSPPLVAFRLYGFALAVAELDECLPALGDESLIRRVYEELAEWKVFRYAATAARGIDRIRGALALRLERMDEAAEWFAAGLEWCERERCPVEAGRCLQGLAEVAERRGKTSEAMGLLDQAAALYRQHGAKLYLDQIIATKVRLQGITSEDMKSSIVVLNRAMQAEKPDLRPAASPEGIVTLLFSDIENSTSLNEEMGDTRWLELLRAHNAVIEQAVGAAGGSVVKTMGDGYMVAFSSARAALSCAIAAQRALRSSDTLRGIRVRMGLHTGEMIREGDDFFGRHVNLAARVASSAHGGEVVVSDVVHELVSGGDFVFTDGGQVAMKGFLQPVRVWHLKWDGQAEAAAPASAAALRIDIDQERQARRVAEVVESEYFRTLRSQTADLRRIVDKN